MRGIRRGWWRRVPSRRGVPVAGVLVVLGALAGCDDDGPTRFVDAASSPGDVTVVQALDNTFRGDTITVEAGSEVHWTNVGLNQHDIVPSDGSDAWGIAKDEFRPGDTYAAQFRVPGEYRYYCSLHGTETSGMVGTIVVEEDGS